MIPSGISDDDAILLLDQQIGALKSRISAGEKIVGYCKAGIDNLDTKELVSALNLIDNVGRIKTALMCLLESNLLANNQSLTELRDQCDLLEKSRQQRSSKIHLGGFVPRARA